MLGLRAASACIPACGGALRQVQGKRAVDVLCPVPDGGSEPYAARGTIASMPPGAAPKIHIPRWIQLVGLPLLLILAWVVAGRVFHVVFLFLVASLLALLLDPLVNAIGSIKLGRFRIRRGISVALVYLSFAAALIVSIWALATVVVDQTKTAANRFDTYFTQPHGQTGQTDADRDVDRLQKWLLGVIGWVPGADKYALVFGAWVAVTELIPYLGPWLGAIPAGIYAVVVRPISLVWVTILFLIIHQIEGHVVVPNVMGSALRL